jgi:hypothetical protein
MVESDGSWVEDDPITTNQNNNNDEDKQSKQEDVGSPEGNSIQSKGVAILPNKLPGNLGCWSTAMMPNDASLLASIISEMREYQTITEEEN